MGNDDVWFGDPKDMPKADLDFFGIVDLEAVDAKSLLSDNNGIVDDDLIDGVLDNGK